MLVLKYIISLILGIASVSFISIILTVLRVGLPMCRNVKNDSDPKLLAFKDAADKLKKKYYISLIIDLIIVIVISLLVYFFMNETFIFYIILVIAYSLLSFGKTGLTDTNISEFNNSLKNNV